MISHLSHRLLTQSQSWTPPTGSGNADMLAAQDAQKNAAPNSAAAMAANVSAAAGLGAQPTSFAAAMNAAGTISNPATDNSDDPTGAAAGSEASDTAETQQFALAGPLLGHHHGSLLSAGTSGTPSQSPGSAQGTITPPSSAIANALHAYRQSAAHGLH